MDYVTERVLIKKGNKALVHTKTRGNNRTEKGFSGTIFWIGEDNYRPGKRLGIKTVKNGEEIINWVHQDWCLISTNNTCYGLVRDWNVVKSDRPIEPINSELEHPFDTVCFWEYVDGLFTLQDCNRNLIMMVPGTTMKQLFQDKIQFGGLLK